MPGAPRSPQFLHLVRLDSARLHGWQLRLPVWHPLSEEREYTELFSDSRFNGDANALKAARARRNELFDAANLPLQLGGRTSNTRNTTGMVGVALSFDRRRGGFSAFKWIAQWQVKARGKAPEQTKKQFNLAMYGFDFALAMAVDSREEKTGLVFSREQRAAAEALRPQVETYVRTGERVRAEGAAGARTRGAAR